MEFESLLKSRALSDYGAFFLPHLTDNMALLDCGCGPGSMTFELAGKLNRGAVIGFDFAARFQAAQEYLRAHPRPNLSFVQGDVDALPFSESSFDAVFAHSLIEMLSPPFPALPEMRRVMREDGVIGIAAVDYSGVLLGGPKIDLLERFYELKEEAWKSAWNSEPRRGKQLRWILTDAGFRDVTASARYISYGQPAAVRRFSEDRAGECARDGEFAKAVVDLRLGGEDLLQSLARAWRAWGGSPGAFLAFPWCSAIGRK